MEKIYLFSSITCSLRKEHRKHLLYLGKREDEAPDIVDNNKWDTNELYDYLKEDSNENRDLEIVKEFANKGNKTEDKAINQLLLLAKTGNISDAKLKKDITSRRPSLVKYGILQDNTDKIKIKDIFKLKNNLCEKSALYVVPQINAEDEKKHKKIKDNWIELLVSFIVEKNEDVKEIYLFLHDKDLSNYGEYDDQMIKEHEEIDKKRKLTVILFKHSSSSAVFNLIRPSGKNDMKEVANDISERYTMLESEMAKVINSLGTVEAVKRIAEKEYMRLNDKKEDDNDTTV